MMFLKVFTLPAILAVHGKVFQRWLAMDAKELRRHLLIKEFLPKLSAWASMIIVDCTKMKEIFNVTRTIPIEPFKK